MLVGTSYAHRFGVCKACRNGKPQAESFMISVRVSNFVQMWSRADINYIRFPTGASDDYCIDIIVNI